MCAADRSILSRLFSQQDPVYQKFQAKLMPTVDPKTIIGVRTPILRKMAKELFGTPESTAFLNCLPHDFYEENNLHAFLLSLLPDYNTAIPQINAFLPFIDNWATCDGMHPKCFSRNKTALLSQIKTWVGSSHVYTIRFGIEMLMTHYLDDAFHLDYPQLVAEIDSDEYYVNMMIAWYFATALAKQYEATLPFIKENKLSPWVHNKAIQKAIESRRISSEQKELLRSLKQ